MSDFSQLLGGGIVLAMPFCYSYEAILVTCLVFAIGMGSWFINLAPVLADHHGIEYIAASYGLAKMFHGLSVLVMPPIFGETPRHHRALHATASLPITRRNSPCHPVRPVVANSLPSVAVLCFPRLTSNTLTLLTRAVFLFYDKSHRALLPHGHLPNPHPFQQSDGYSPIA